LICRNESNVLALTSLPADGNKIIEKDFCKFPKTAGQKIESKNIFSLASVYNSKNKKISQFDSHTH